MQGVFTYHDQSCLVPFLYFTFLVAINMSRMDFLHKFLYVSIKLPWGNFLIVYNMLTKETNIYLFKSCDIVECGDRMSILPTFNRKSVLPGSG